MAEQSESVVLSFSVDVEDSIVSIKKLTDANKALREERKNLNISSVEGKKRIDEINATIDKNTATIKTNVSAIEQQKINIGNYKSALDGIAPGLGKFAEGLQAGTKGFKAMTMQALAFIATPIGLVIAAIGAALFALTSYFKGSEEGQNSLNKVVAVGSAIFEQFMNIVEAVGKIIFDAISNPKQALIDFGNLVKENIINRFVGMLEFLPAIGKAIGLLFEGKFSEAGQVAFDAVAKVTVGVADATSKINGLIDSTGKLIEEGITNGQRIAAFTAKIDKDERKLIEDRAKTSLEVAKLREKAINLEGDAKRKVIKEAIALEEELSNREVELSKIRLALAETELKANGDDKEALNKVAEARAALSSAEETAFGNTLKFRKELSGLDNERAQVLKKQNDELERQAKLEKDAADAQAEAVSDSILARIQAEIQAEKDIQQLRIDMRAEGLNKEIAQLNFQLQEKLSKLKGSEEQITEQTLLLEEQRNRGVFAIREEYRQKDIQEDEKAKAKEKDNENKLTNLKEQEHAARLQALSDVTRDSAVVFGEQSALYKASASAETLIGTFEGAQKSYNALAGIVPVGPALGAAAAALAVAAGLARVAAINNVQFEQGGVVLKGRSHAQGGIPIEAEGDEIILTKGVYRNPQLRQMASAINVAGGGIRFADGGVAARAISNPINQAFEISNMLKNMPAPVVSVKEINRGQKAVRVKQNISKR